MTLLKALFGGMFLFNALPHLIKGITGDKHMTPFKRISSPILNILWSFTNIVLVVLILGFDTNGALNFPKGMNFWIFLLGGFSLSLTAAKLFDGPNARLPWHKD
ncbi:hypothetical protein COT75_04050 [Candidatus Beckwithbacteria bacterium CG10_big_fil_rev_8_21_14_0_10_34_10]|uniref:Uncharacterized protein n=1 Tax=Candidatus Beckwithbacteria bacterium CG10_big_fil_rev_8_21_14_0_10_34_10 TaxID=1974495 RepID=A0A2H0W8W6_9BACT|nr:MAG: hypothetical protein COT75_04050 [Candidatus Beckwithbacteria bacterium CG10_big_fil_rev_8_21_14_0_10_34_10]